MSFENGLGCFCSLCHPGIPPRSKWEGQSFVGSAALRCAGIFCVAAGAAGGSLGHTVGCRASPQERDWVWDGAAGRMFGQAGVWHRGQAQPGRGWMQVEVPQGRIRWCVFPETREHHLPEVLSSTFGALFFPKPQF